MLEAFGNHTKSQGLDARHGLVAVSPVAHDTSEIWHFGQPAAITFALKLD